MHPLSLAKIVALVLPALLAFCSPTAFAQGDLPDPSIRLRPVLVAIADRDNIRVTMVQTVQEERTRQYTEEVPYTEQVTDANGNTIMVVKTRTEVRTGTYVVNSAITKEVLLSPGDYKLRRADDGRVTKAQIVRPAEALAFQVDSLDRVELPAFYRQILKRESLILFVAGSGRGAQVALGESPIGSAPPVGGAQPPGPGPNGEVHLTMLNRSGQAVEIFYYDEQQDADVSFIPRMGAGDDEGAETYDGTRWIARAGDRMVSDFYTPSQREAIWEIGPPVRTTDWQGDNGVRFRRGRGGVWSYFDAAGKLVRTYTEEERTDQRVGLYNADLQEWIRLLKCEAVYDSPGSNGWQVLATCTPDDATAQPPPPRPAPPRPAPPKPRPAPRGSAKKSAASASERETMLKMHNRARRDVGVGEVTWSDDLARYAQEWADHLASIDGFDHRQNSPYGENLAIARDATRACATWIKEIDDYNGQKIEGDNYLIFGHYTQIVWRGTGKIGCGKATVNGKTIWVCNYDPPGNMQGEKPY